MVAADGCVQVQVLEALGGRTIWSVWVSHVEGGSALLSALVGGEEAGQGMCGWEEKSGCWGPECRAGAGRV
jgi:hypothetical protein